MSEFTVKPSDMDIRAGELAGMQKELDRYVEELGSIITSGVLESAGFQATRAELEKLKSMLAARRRDNVKLEQTLRSCADLYRRCESEIIFNCTASPSEKVRHAIEKIIAGIRDIINIILTGLGRLFGGPEESGAIYDGDPINMCNGSYVNETADFSNRGIMDLNFVRYYNSVGCDSGALGDRWSHKYELHLEREDKDTIIMNWGNGSKEIFERKDGGVYLSKYGNYDILVDLDDSCVYKKKNGNTYYFDIDGRISKEEDANGNHLKFTYEGKKLVLVEDNYGHELHLSYDESSRITKVVTDTGKTASYTYEDGRLCTVERADESRILYAYDEVGFLFSITDPCGNTVIRNHYDEQGRVTEQELADGNRLTIGYSENETVYTDAMGMEVRYGHDDKLRHTYTKWADCSEEYSYDEHNNRKSYTDRNGNRHERSFDEKGNVIAYTDPCGNTTIYEYDSEDRIIRSVLSNGAETRAEYDVYGNVVAVINAAGMRSKIEYDKGKVVKITHPDMSVAEFFYDQRGNMIAEKKENGAEYHYEYDADDRCVAMTAPKGEKILYRYDAMDRVVGITNAIGKEKTISYLPNGKLSEITDFDGFVEKWEYSPTGRPVCHTDKEGRKQQYVYDAGNNLIEMIRANGAVCRYSYDCFGNRIRVEDEAGAVRTYAYDRNGNCIEKTANGIKETFSYDAMNRMINRSSEDGNSESMIYDSVGNCTKVTRRDGTSIEYSYDLLGRRVAVTDPKGQSISSSYDERGKLVESTTKTGFKTEYAYTAGGRIKNVRYADGRAVAFEYDAENHMIRREDSNGYWQSYDYDVLGRKVAVRDSVGNTMALEYDDVDRIVSKKDTRGLEEHFSYSPGGKLIQVEDSQKQIARYTYDERDLLVAAENAALKMQWIRDKAGRIVKEINVGADSCEYEYNEYGQLIRKTAEGEDATVYSYGINGMVESVTREGGDRRSYRYDTMGRMTEAANALGTVKISYDAVGHVESVTDIYGNKTGYEWNGDDQKTGIRYPNGEEERFEYDEGGRLSKISFMGHEVNYSYDVSGRLIEKRTDSMGVRYQYNAAGQIVQMTYSEGKEADLSHSCEYIYDEKGNIVKEKTSGADGRENTVEYSYDEKDRIVSVRENGKEREHYEYDGNGIILSEHDNVREKYEYDEKGRLIRISGEGEEVLYSYDGSGRMVERKSSKGTEKFSYNEFGKLSRVENTDGSVAEYEYDALDNMVSKKKGESRTEYSYDLTKSMKNLIQKNDGKKCSSYAWDRNLLFSSNDDRHYVYQCDRQGSIRKKIDLEDGTAEGYEYGVYGEPKSAVEIGYTGLEYDTDIKAYWTPNRLYDPERKSFLSADGREVIRLTIPGTLNLYAYCMFNPMSFTDPEGLDCYIFYLPEWEDEAKVDQARLAREYGVDISQVHLVPITNKEELTAGWNAMGYENGQQVDIDAVVIDTHANSSVLGFGDNSPNPYTADDIRNLQDKDIDQLILYGCNAGHSDYVGTNPASEFARKVNGAPVLASDGTVYGQLSNADYDSRNDNHFRNQLRYGDRDNNGWMIYQYMDGEVSVTGGIRKALNVTEMVRILMRRNELCPN